MKIDADVTNRTGEWTSMPRRSWNFEERGNYRYYRGNFYIRTKAKDNWFVEQIRPTKSHGWVRPQAETELHVLLNNITLLSSSSISRPSWSRFSRNCWRCRLFSVSCSVITPRLISSSSYTSTRSILRFPSRKNSVSLSFCCGNKPILWSKFIILKTILCKKESFK